MMWAWSDRATASTSSPGRSLGASEGDRHTSGPVRTMERLPLRLGSDSSSTAKSGLSARSEPCTWVAFAKNCASEESWRRPSIEPRERL